MTLQEKAGELLRGFKGDDYAFGLDKLGMVGDFAAEYGSTALVIGNQRYLEPAIRKVIESLDRRGVKIVGNGIVPDAGPNAPREDVYRLESYILHFQPDCIVIVGGGSSIDAAKAANALAALGVHSPELESYFGINLVTEALRKTGRSLRPLIAVESAASSGAHLTKYANITDPVAGQKKLIVDDALVPARAVFDYGVTVSMPASLTIDGALDGIAHCLEVFYGIDREKYGLMEEIAATGIELAVRYAKQAVEEPGNMEARIALGLATDLGAYAIMTGGTNGAHLTSFSLVDIASHGRACGLMNPYYTVFFAPAIEPQLRTVGEIFKRCGYIRSDLSGLRGRELGVAVAEGMVTYARAMGAPTKLAELQGFADEHIERALAAAKNPQLEMKLKNMPVPLTAAQVDEYMRPILEAARNGDFGLIRNME